MKPRCWLALLAYMLCAPAGAFEGWEHKRLGDLSYHIAMRAFCETNGKSAVCDLRAKKRAQNDPSKFFDDPLAVGADTAESASHKQLTYGDVVRCVDFFLTAEKLLAGRESHLVEGGTRTSQRVGKLLPETPRDLDLDEARRCNAELTNLEGARAGHVNHTHFQAELLVAQRTNHMLALNMRTSEDNLFAALAVNAISDHFLQDVFAPGHITTWRSRLTDIAANAYHDRNNRRGWDVDVDKDMLKNITRIPSAKEHVNLMDTILAYLSDQSEVRDHFFHPGEEGVADCGANCTKVKKTVQGRQDDLAAFVARVKGEGPLTVSFKGDKQLWQEGQDQQRLLMLWTEVRSIFDILESRLVSQDSEAQHIVLKDSFKDNSWSWIYVPHAPKSEQFVYPTAESKIEANIGPVKYLVTERDRRTSDKTNSPGWVDYKDMDQIVGVSFGIDNMTYGDAQIRRLMTFETVVAGQASMSRYFENHAIVIGYQRYFGPGPDGYALSARHVWVKPEIESTLSLQLRAIRLGRVNAPAMWRPSIGVRLDLGFSSFLTNYIQFSRDVAIQNDGRARPGLSIGAGIQLGAPTCRIPGAASIANCY